VSDSDLKERERERDSERDGERGTMGERHRELCRGRERERERERTRVLEREEQECRERETESSGSVCERVWRQVGSERLTEFGTTAAAGRREKTVMIGNGNCKAVWM